MEKPKIIKNGNKEYIFVGEKAPRTDFIYSEKMEKKFGEACDLREDIKCGCEFVKK